MALRSMFSITEAGLNTKSQVAGGIVSLVLTSIEFKGGLEAGIAVRLSRSGVEAIVRINSRQDQVEFFRC